ncbi:MAG: hypothetical protein KDI17_14345 [Halioglobus sp.]|nr:hypothetical protein [Halioglobus sp.]
MKLALQIALGIILATAILSFGGLATTAGVAWWANKQIERTLTEQREQQAERDRAAIEARRAEVERERLAAIQAQQARKASEARRLEQNSIANAFEDQYRPPPGCTNPQSDTRWVECVDIRARAKAEFMGKQRLFKESREEIRIAD